MPNFIALDCLEVGLKFVEGGGGVGAFPYQLPSNTNLKLG